MIFIKVRNFSKCVVTKTRYMYIFEKVALEGEGNNVWKCTFLIKFSSHLQIWFFCKVHIRGKLCYTYNITKIGQVIVFLDYTRMKTIDGNIQDDKNRYIYILNQKKNRYRESETKIKKWCICHTILFKM